LVLPVDKLGSRLLGGILRFGGSVGSASDVARDFGVSKQAASKLIDTLVIRGYVNGGVGAEAIRQMRATVGAPVALRKA
jgi:DNA-binding MarR family transcriptional regulator